MDVRHGLFYLQYTAIIVITEPQRDNGDKKIPYMFLIECQKKKKNSFCKILKKK